MNVPLDEVIYFDAITTHPSTGAATDADSTPTFAVYEEATDTDIGVGGNLTKRTSLTGNYRGSFTLSAANGFEVGKWYSIIASATVNSVAGKAVVKNFRVVAAEAIAGKPKADVDAWLGTAAETPDTAGVPHVNFVYLNNNTTTVDNMGNVFGTDFATNYDDTNNRWLVDVRMISGDATAADNAEAFFDGTGYAGTGNVIPTVTAVTAISSGGITEASFATTAGSFHPLGIIDQGTAQAATGTTLQLRSAAAFANDELLGVWILITGGTTGVGQVRRITDYVASTDTATVDTWTTTPSGTITYKIFAAPPVIDVNVSHVGGTAGSVGVFPSGSITSNVLATGCIGANQVAADAIGADELATDAITEVVNAVWANATRTLSAATNITSTGGTTVPQTGDAYAIVNSGTHGNAAIKGYVDDIGTAGAGLTAIPWNAAWDAEVQSECADALTAYGASTVTTAQVNAEVLDVINVDTLIDGKTIKEAVRAIAATTTAKVSGAGTGTEVFVGMDGTTVRVTATVDASGNRTAVVYG